MYGKKYNKVLTILLVIIIIAVIGLIAYLIINKIITQRNVSEAEEYVDEFLQQVDSNMIVVSGNLSSDDDSNDDDGSSLDDLGTTGTSSGSSSSSSSTATYKGFEMLGTIEIPATGVKLPILAKVTVKSLQTSVATIWPQPDPVLNDYRNVVIVGHNFRNGTFFSDNKKLSIGDTIKITDLTGTKVTYVIYNIFETDDNDTSFYNRDTDGKREVTLSTCTDDSLARLIIEAREE